MEEIVNLIATDSAASEISDKIKDALFAKAADKIDATRQSVGVAMFDNDGDAPESTEEE